jgi:serine/threonine protein kinase
VYAAPAAPAPARPPAPAPAVHEDDDGEGLPVGTRLHEFEITKLVGVGGFGVVYSATDHSLQRRVALKEYMPGSLAQRTGTMQVSVKSERYRETFEAGRKSFVNEARLLASFDHPSLVKVYRFWEDNGTAYMVMPFLEGKTLRDILRGLPHAPDEVWLRSVLGPLTEALMVIHAEQCFHRDIAPDNVMQLPTGRWLLLDFGAARRVIGDMTQALTVILKPGYAPVEQYAEIPGMKQGAWTDVYALAAVVHYAIMGRTPPPSVGRLLNDTYLPLVQAAAGRFSEPFLAAIDRALAVRPEQRTQTIAQLRDELGLDAIRPQSTVMPMAPAPAPPALAGSSQPTMALGAPLPPTALVPPRSAPAPAPAQPQALAATAAVPVAGPGSGNSKGDSKGNSKSNGALIGIGAGVVVLGAVGFGVWKMMSTPAPAPAPASAPTVAAAPVAAPAPAPVATPAPPPPVRFEAVREFDRVVAAQAGGFNLRATMVKGELSIARKDEVKFTVTADRDGLLYVMGTGPDGTLALLVPNKNSPTVRVRKGQTYSFPTRDGFYLSVGEPLGTSTLLAMVSALPRRFDAMQPRAEGPVQMLASGDAATPILAAHTGTNSPLAGMPVCPAATPGCADEYGAAVLRFDTVK